MFQEEIKESEEYDPFNVFAVTYQELETILQDLLHLRELCEEM